MVLSFDELVKLSFNFDTAVGTLCWFTITDVTGIKQIKNNPIITFDISVSVSLDFCPMTMNI